MSSYLELIIFNIININYSFIMYISMEVLIADVLKLKIVMLDSQICIIFIMAFVFS